MKMVADIRAGVLTVEGTAQFHISCNVRTLANGNRRHDEVVRSIPSDHPYDPKPFPKGIWNVISVEWQEIQKFNADVYGPVKIRTDAAQPVKVWDLDKDGDYMRETETVVNDRGYLLHYSTSSTTLGCIRIGSRGEAESIAKVVEQELSAGRTVELEVI